MPKSGYRFFNIPKKCGNEDYRHCINHLIKKYSETEGLNAVYEWGDVSQPGISDLDIVFVFDKNPKPLPFLKRSFFFNSNKTRYLVRHPFIFIDKESFEEIRYIYPDTSFKLLHGEKIRIKEITKKEGYYAKISLLNDLIIRHYPRDFFEQQANKSINVRDTLLRLNSIKYTVMTFGSITKEKHKRWNDFTNNIMKLRQNWFKNMDYNRLAELNSEAISTSMDIIGRFRKFLLENRLVKIISGDEARYNGIKNRSFFILDWSPENGLSKIEYMAKNNEKIEIFSSVKSIPYFLHNKKYYSVLPLELYPQLVEYSKYNGGISSYIRKNINPEISYKLKYKSIAGKRIKILNNQALLADKLRHSDFVAFFDFGYRNISGINNFILNSFDKIRF